MACNQPPPPPLQKQPLPTVPETPDIEERHLKREVTEADDEPKFNFPAVNVGKEEKTFNVVAEVKNAAEVMKVNPRKRKAVSQGR